MLNLLDVKYVCVGGGTCLCFKNYKSTRKSKESVIWVLEYHLGTKMSMLAGTKIEKKNKKIFFLWQLAKAV